MKHRVSEVFGPTIQGEGGRTGIMSVWVRQFGCNLSCSGFGQKDPTNPETYVLPYKDIDIANISKMEDLPVFEYGCDSSYSWSAKFKHLTHDYTTEELAQQLYSLLPGHKFKHPTTGQTYDLCITGGEPMMQQKQTVALINYMIEQDNFPYDIQIETNGTKPISQDLASLIDRITTGIPFGRTNWFWSISPKLWNVSGEDSCDAWNPGVIKAYYDCNPHGWLKFVMTDSDAAWSELNAKTAELREIGVAFPIYVMGAGATKAQQEDVPYISAIAQRAIREGYHFSGRLHCNIWGNTVGV